MHKIIILILLSSCTCNYHLNRAKLKCGYSFKSDTVYKTLTVNIPGVDTNGTKPASTNVDSLATIIQELFTSNNSLKTKNDSLLVQSLKQRLGAYITNRPCLTDTLTIAVNGGFVKLWQTGGRFYWNVKIPPQVIERKVPVVVNRTEVKESHPWWVHVFLILLAITGIVFIVLTFRIVWKKQLK